MHEADHGAGEPAGQSHFVQSLARGLDVIRAFDAEHPRMSLTEVARRTGLSRATSRRFLLTLADLGYVRARGRGFELAPAVLELGYSYLSSAALPQLVEPVLEELSAALGESVSASVLDGGDIVYIARVHTRRIMRVSIAVGTRFPAYATSMGRVLLAHLPPAEREAAIAARPPERLTPHTVTDPQALAALLEQVRAQGWCLVDQELELGLRSLAVPVTGPDGTVVAAVNASMSALALDTAELPATVREFLPVLQRGAGEIEQALRARR